MFWRHNKNINNDQNRLGFMWLAWERVNSCPVAWASISHTSLTLSKHSWHQLGVVSCQAKPTVGLKPMVFLMISMLLSKFHWSLFLIAQVMAWGPFGDKPLMASLTHNQHRFEQRNTVHSLTKYACFVLASSVFVQTSPFIIINQPQKSFGAIVLRIFSTKVGYVRKLCRAIAPSFSNYMWCHNANHGMSIYMRLLCIRYHN